MVFNTYHFLMVYAVALAGLPQATGREPPPVAQACSEENNENP